MNEDRIFREEQAHLTEQYGKLARMKEQMEAELIDLQRQAQEEKNTVADDLQYDFVGIEESQETLIEFETMRSRSSISRAGRYRWDCSA